jgi:hypothetical protein
MDCKRFILCFCVFFMMVSCQNDPQGTNTKQIRLDPVLEDYESPDRKIGFMDTVGQMVIEPQYDEVRDFQSGRAAVNYHGLWGYIEPSGKWVVEPKYLGAWSYSEGLARVQSAENRKIGYVDLKGEEYIPPMYEDASDFQFGWARMKRGNYYGLIDFDNTLILEPKYEGIRILSAHHVAVKENGQWFIHDIEKNVRKIGPYEAVYSEQFDLFRVKLSNGTIQVVDTTGHFLFNEDFEGVDFTDDKNTFIVQLTDTSWALYQVGKNLQSVSGVYARLRAVGEGLIAAEKAGKWGLVDLNGQHITEYSFDQLYHFQDGYAPVMINRLWGYISKDGELAVPATFGLAWPFQERKARVLTRNGIGVIDDSFEFMVRPGIGEVRDYSEGRAAVKTYND